MVKSENKHEETLHMVEYLNNRIWILFMKESTSGVAEGQTTAAVEKEKSA